MSGGATTAPMVAPLLNTAMAKARSRTGNHSATALAAPGQFPASPIPRRNRKAPSCVTLRAAACSIEATVQMPTNSMKPARVPTRSSTFPETVCEIV